MHQQPISTAATSPVARLLRPHSVAIIGVASRTGTPAWHTLRSLGDFPGDIYLVGRSGGTLDGRPILESVDDLPEDIGLAIFTLPAAGVREALEACVRRRVRAVTVFSAGFAEIGNQAEQDAVTKIARDAGIPLLGPNCMGYTNLVDGFAVKFASEGPLVPLDPASRDPAIGVVAHSGGLASHIRTSLQAVDLNFSYIICSGNEAGLGLGDFTRFLADDPMTKMIILYVEEIRDPATFLVAVNRAREVNKPVLMMHPGRSARAQAALASHTGALAGDFAVMRTVLTRAGVLMFDDFEEMLDVAEILARFPEPPTKAAGIVSSSGAFCAIACDFCDDLGFELATLSPAVETELKAVLPEFVRPHNPVDMGAQTLRRPEAPGLIARSVLSDPSVGSVLVAIMSGVALPATARPIVETLHGTTKPMVVSLFGGATTVNPEFLTIARENRMILSRSYERSLRALAKVTRYGQDRARGTSTLTAVTTLPKLGSGPQSEWRGKELLAAFGVGTPKGGLATSVDKAAEIAGKIGYPVVMKAQADQLLHKTEAGGVLLGVADEAALRRGWQTLHGNIAKHQPSLQLDGVLVEQMVPRGVELVVGAKRNPAWGAVLLVGLGGIWVEALGDVRLLPVDLPEDTIIDELQKLRAAKLFNGFRGSPPVDLRAAAKVVSALGRLMVTTPEIVEVDINPLIVQADGHGATAADALIVTR